MVGPLPQTIHKRESGQPIGRRFDMTRVDVLLPSFVFLGVPAWSSRALGVPGGSSSDPWAFLGGPWGSLSGPEASLGICVSTANSFVIYTERVIHVLGTCSGVAMVNTALPAVRGAQPAVLAGLAWRSSQSLAERLGR